MFYFLIPKTAHAMDINELMSKVNKVIINPIIILLFAIALVVFLYGIVEFMANPDNEETKEKGKSHMIWGVLGMAIMVGTFGIMQIIIATFGFTGQNGAIVIPQAQ